MRHKTFKKHGLARALRGFTLIELLVVVAIIVVLIAILMPSLAGARDNAKTVQCQANMRQVYMSYIYYADENNQSIPHAVTSGYNPNDVLCGQAAYLAPNEKYPNTAFTAVSVCPTQVAAMEAVRRTSNNTSLYTVPVYWPNPTYWTNTIKMNVILNNQSPPLEVPAGMAAMLGEVNVTGTMLPNIAGGLGANVYLWDFTYPARNGFYHRKETATNVVCFDGHVETLGKNDAKGRLTGKMYWMVSK